MLKLSTKSKMQNLLLIFLFLTLKACDCQRQSMCEWRIERDDENNDMSSSGYTSVCIKNYKLGKQKCFLEMTDELVGSSGEKYYRYEDLNINADTMPRRIEQSPSCTPESTN